MEVVVGLYQLVVFAMPLRPTFLFPLLTADPKRYSLEFWKSTCSLESKKVAKKRNLFIKEIKMQCWPT